MAYKITIILLFIWNTSIAATRLYFTQLTPQVTATFNAGWNVTTGATTWLLNSYIDRSSQATVTSGGSGAVSPRQMLCQQFMSQPCMGQTLNGTLTGQIRFVSSVGGGVVTQGFVYFRIINADGSVASDVGTMTTTNLTTTATNRTLIALTLTNVTVTGGQRLCLEVGINYSAGSGTVNTGSSFFLATTTATDLPADNTTTTALRPWAEFSQNVYFYYQGITMNEPPLKQILASAKMPQPLKKIVIFNNYALLPKRIKYYKQPIA